MSRADNPAGPHPGAQVQALAAALTKAGLTTAVYRTGGHQECPCVWIASGWARQPEVIYAAPDNGHWWFWWSSLDRIARLADVGRAADTILARFPVCSRVRVMAV